MLIYAIVMIVLKTSNMKSPDHILMDEDIELQVSACQNHFALLQTISRAGTEEDGTGELTSVSQLELETSKPGAPYQHARFRPSTAIRSFIIGTDTNVHEHVNLTAIPRR